jgi:hypothetical protein
MKPHWQYKMHFKFLSILGINNLKQHITEYANNKYISLKKSTALIMKLYSEKSIFYYTIIADKGSN